MSGKGIVKIFPGSFMVSRNHKKGQDLAVNGSPLPVQHGQGFQKNIYPFVFVFIATADSHQEGIRVYFPVQHARSGLQQFLPSL